MLTARHRSTPVIGAGIIVITGKRGTCNTSACYAAFQTGADIAVIAVTVRIALAAGNGGIHAPRPRIAGVTGAAVSVIAEDRIARLAVSIGAIIRGSADTAVIAG
jgi:hypothetical protein